MKQLLLILIVSLSCFLFGCSQKTSAPTMNESIEEEVVDVIEEEAEEYVDIIPEDPIPPEPTIYVSEDAHSLPSYSPNSNDVVSNDSNSSSEEFTVSHVEAAPEARAHFNVPAVPTVKSSTKKTAKKPIADNPVMTVETSASLSAPVDQATRSDGSHMAQIISGRLIEYFPDSMEVGKLSRVVVEISPDTSSAGMKMEIQQHSTLSNNQASIKTSIISGIGENMRASLKGDRNHFEIEAMTESTLRKVDLSAKKFIRWEWDVRPILAGNHSLSLVLERLDGEASDPIPILTKDIAVTVEKTFLRSYAGLIGAFVLALLGGLFFYFKRAKTRTKELAFQHKDQVFSLIGANKTEKALTLLESAFANEHLHDEVTMIKARFNDSKEKALKGILDNDTIAMERNKINSAILDLIKDLA